MLAAHASVERTSSHALPIFVISLKRRTDRLQHMQALLGARGLDAEFVEAVDGTVLTLEQRARYDRRRALAVYGAEMNPAEIGCHLSHLKVYRLIVERGLETALVLEDDIDCDADFAELLGSVLARPQPEWLILRLQSIKGEIIRGDRPSTRGDRLEAIRGRTLARVRSGIVGGCAYLIRREGAVRMLRYAERPFMPIDQTMDRYWENGIAPYVLRPFPVRQSPRIVSEISTRKVRPALGAYGTVARRVRRAADGVLKRLFAMTRLGGWRRFAEAAPVTGAVHRSLAWRAVEALSSRSHV